MLPLHQVVSASSTSTSGSYRPIPGMMATVTEEGMGTVATPTPPPLDPDRFPGMCFPYLVLNMLLDAIIPISMFMFSHY